MNNKKFFITNKDIISFSKDNSDNLSNAVAGLILTQSNKFKMGENLYGKPIAEDYSSSYSPLKDSNKLSYLAYVKFRNNLNINTHFLWVYFKTDGYSDNIQTYSENLHLIIKNI